MPKEAEGDFVRIVNNVDIAKYPLTEVYQYQRGIFSEETGEFGMVELGGKFTVVQVASLKVYKNEVTKRNIQRFLQTLNSVKDKLEHNL
jgi:hypothetical protein